MRARACGWVGVCVCVRARACVLACVYLCADGYAGCSQGVRNQRVLVFVATKREADMLEEYLYNQHFPATSIHGDRTQTEREQALKSFRNGQAKVLVATDVCARGIDIPNVAMVVNYDMPNQIEDYVHRIGRTGRAGNDGSASAFITPKDARLAKDLCKILQVGC